MTMTKKQTKVKESTAISRYAFDWVTTYLPKQRIESVKTQESYKLSLKLFLDYLDSTDVKSIGVEQLSPSTINGWIQWMIETRKNSVQTCNARLAAIKSFIKYVGTRDATMRNLYLEVQDHVKKLRAPKRKVHGVSRAALKVLLNIHGNTSKDVRDRAFMVLMYGAALRLGEMLSLKIKDLHLKAEHPSVTIVGKGNVMRTPYLVSPIPEILEDYVKKQHGNSPNLEDYLFYSPYGGEKRQLSQEAIRKRFKQIAAKAHKVCDEVPLTLHPHQFRHARSQQLLDDGLSIADLSKFLGHANIETTMVYLDITPDQISKAIEKLESENDMPVTLKRWKGKTSQIDDLRASLGF